MRTPPEDAGVTAEEPTAPPGELRLVSVLFCDLVGSTSMAEHRDDDEFRELLDGYYEVAKTVVARYGGTIQKFIGDAVVAVWGTPRALEDDAGRTVRAALELVDSVVGYGQRVGQPTLAARAGVVTGRAAAVDDQDVIVVGDRVNTAARVQSSAEAGEVLVDDVTFEATRASVAYTDAGTFELKGKTDSEHLWRAESVVAGTAGLDRLDGLEARFVGRDSELRLVKELFHTVVERGSARLVSVVGPAGSGKSRLRSEFYRYIDGLADITFWHGGRGVHYGEGVAFWALAEMVRQRFGVAEDDTFETASTKLTEGLDELVPDEGDRAFLKPRLAHLVGVGGGERSRDDLFAGWRLLFERMAEQHPVVLAVEDLQWADEGFLDFLESIVDWSAKYPILMLTLSRPELADSRPGWGQRRGATTINLEPLDPGSMAGLLADLVDDLPPDLVNRIVDRSDGVPLYAVETIRSLVDRDLVQPRGGSYHLVGKVDRLQVPATLTALLAARLDALEPEERSLVKDLSVLGTSFPRESVRGVTDIDPDRLEQIIGSLVEKEILAVRSDRLSPERGQFQFTQNLLRTVAYDTLTRREKHSRHLDAARQLRNEFPDDGAEVADLVASHYQSALDLIPDAPDSATVRSEAAAAYRRAGDRSAELGAPAAAFVAYRKAARLLEATGNDLNVVVAAGRMASRAGMWADAVTLLEDAASRLELEGDADEARGVVAELVLAQTNWGHPEEAIRLAGEALEKTPLDAVGRGTAALLVRYGRNLVFAGRSEAATLIDRAIGMASALGDKKLLANSLDAEATRLWFSGRTVLSHLVAHGAVEASRASGFFDDMVKYLSNLGDALLGSDLPAVDVLQEAVDGARRLGDPVILTISASNLANVLIYVGSWSDAASLSMQTIEEAAEYEGAAAGLLYDRLALINALRGDLEAARKNFDRAAELLAPADREDVGIHGGTGAAIQLIEGDHAAVLSGIDEIAGLAATFGWSSEMPRQMWPDAAEAALRSGELATADRLISLLEAEAPGRLSPYLQAQLTRTQARMAAARGETDGVEEGLHSAIERFSAMSYPYWEAMARLDLANWLIDQDRNEEAVLLSDTAAEIFERLGAAPDLDRARRVATAAVV